MSKIYRTAQGKPIDLDSLLLANETTIAVGNMKVNARGDQLGAGGKITASRNQTMDQHYKLQTPIATTDPQQVMQQHVRAGARTAQGVAATQTAAPAHVPENVDPSGFSFDPPTEQAQAPLRGSLADSIAKRNQ